MTSASFRIRYYDSSGDETEDRGSLDVACQRLEQRLAERLSEVCSGSMVSAVTSTRHVSFQIDSPTTERGRLLEIILEDLDFLDLLQWSEKINCR